MKLKRLKAGRALTWSLQNVSPINTIGGAKKHCHITHHFGRIDKNTVPLRRVSGARDVSLVLLPCAVTEAELTEHLRLIGKKPCPYAANYLLGVLALVPEEDMPNELKFRHIVAVEPGNPASTFLDPEDKKGGPKVLWIDRNLAKSGGKNEPSRSILTTNADLVDPTRDFDYRTFIAVDLAA